MVNPIRSALHCVLPQAHEPEVAPQVGPGAPGDPNQEQLGPCGRPIGGYREIGMALEGGWGKDVLACKNGVAPDYLSSRRRGQFEVTVGKDDHRLYQRDEQGRPARIHTRDSDKFLYAMDKDGHIYAAPASEVEHHSAFLAGHPGAAFGILSVKEGEIQYLDNESGHYLPPADYGYQMLHELKARGVKVPKDRVVFKGSRAQLRKLGEAPKVRLCPDASHLKTMKH
jgi:hypothetical protein